MIEKKIAEEIISDANNNFFDVDNCFSKSRDVFTARLQSFIIETKKYLEAAVIGEIGNNTFDHNFGFSSAHPGGVYCNFEYKQRYVVLADYGRGIKQSLLAVLPAIDSDVEAVKIAFTKRVSGRSPEQRGNGLKFVSETIQQNNWHLYFQSGLASCSIDRNGLIFSQEPVLAAGCLAIINFGSGK